MQSFGSDNHSEVHGAVLQAMLSANSNSAMPYGEDTHTEQLKDIFCKLLECDVDVYLCANGTGANVSILSAMTSSYGAVICADSAHVTTHECGAFEKFSGAKIVTINSSNGKILPSDIEPLLTDKNFVHCSQPQAITVSNTTETGNIYSMGELKALGKFAKDNELYFHLDGARIANACAHLNTNLKTMITECSMDALSFGLTKNGGAFGDIAIIINDKLKNAYPYHQKQFGQLMSKQRFLSAQGIALMKDDLWLKNAKNANDTAQYIAKNLETFGFIPLYPDFANELFYSLPNCLAEKLSQEFSLYIIQKGTQKSVVRIVSSWNSTMQSADALISCFKN